MTISEVEFFKSSRYLDLLALHIGRQPCKTLPTLLLIVIDGGFALGVLSVLVNDLSGK